MRINTHLTPPKGHVFTDSEGVTHRGESWAHLVRVVAQYRALRALPPGNPHKEITQQVCYNNPRLCMKGGTDSLAGGDKNAYHLRVATWIAKRTEDKRQGRLRYVGTAEAQDRAEVCRQCPFQNEWQKDCRICQKGTVALRKSFVGDRPNSGQGLLGCELLSEDTHVSIHLAQPGVPDARLPKKCWRRK